MKFIQNFMFTFVYSGRSPASSVAAGIDRGPRGQLCKRAGRWRCVICKDFRGQGIGSALINISIEWAKHKNLHGLMLETQDNNLIACKFYHNCGFKIGSVDTMLYANFENNFEKAVFWYLRF